MRLRFGVWGLGLGFGGWSLEFGVWGLGFRGSVRGDGVHMLRVSGFGFEGFVVWVQGFESKLVMKDLQVSGFGTGAQGYLTHKKQPPPPRTTIGP